MKKYIIFVVSIMTISIFTTNSFAINHDEIKNIQSELNNISEQYIHNDFLNCLNRLNPIDFVEIDPYILEFASKQQEQHVTYCRTVIVSNTAKRINEILKKLPAAIDDIPTINTIIKSHKYWHLYISENLKLYQTIHENNQSLIMLKILRHQLEFIAELNEILSLVFSRLS